MKKKILILASNPRNDLKLNREIKDLKNVIKRSKNQSQFETEFELEVHSEELHALLLQQEPRIVHFCGHGTGEQGLVLQNQAGREQVVSTEALSNLFELFDKQVEGVILNACYSEVQANAIVQHINYVIGMSDEISDDAAIAFATGFYRALGWGKSIEEAYKFGRNAIQIQIAKANTSRSRSSGASRKLVAVDVAEQVIIPEHLKPALKKKSPLTTFSQEVTSAPSVDYPNSSTQYPPELIEALQEEERYKGYRDRARETWDEFGQFHLVERKPISQNEYRQRKTLLNKVKDWWIEGFLKPSVYANAAINLDWKNSSDAVLRPFEGSEDIPVELDESFEELQPTDILTQTGLGKTLLILGEPGSGKTITLLQLAEKLVNQTERDLTKPIPVVFNLSSWGQKQQPIEKWLIEEFKDKYQVPQTWSEPWIKQEQLILLLDGLDEVKAEQRNACVRALNQFIVAHNITEMVVCSRVKDYEALTERLQLSSAICIKPLSPKQVYSFLAKAGDSLAGLKTLLQQDRELEQFAQTPLILNIMSLAYQDWSVEDLLQQFRSSEECRQHLFNAYIERMFKRKGVNQQYQKDRAIHWLTWLAQRMSQASQSVFLIEKIQPNWLQTNLQRRLYRIGTILIGILVIGLILFLSKALDSHNVKINLEKVLTINVVMWGLVLWWNFGRDKAEIETFETLTWPWKKTRKDLLDGLTSGLSWSLILSPIGVVWCSLTWKEPKWPSGYWKIIIFGLILGLIFALIIGLIRGLRGSEIETKTIPNQGIWRSARNAGIIVLVSWLILFPIIFRLFPKGLQSTTSVISWGLILGLLFGGGIACIQHFSLRLILWVKGFIPKNLARFLDYASERIFLQKVGGGYIFVHRMLMEHFAQRDRVSRVPVPVTPRQTYQPVAKGNTRTKISSSNIINTLPRSSNLVQNLIVCSNCERRNPTNGKFCTKCGSQLGEHS
jgi:DNA polymerase III delta prime subunit/ribosomal protein L40E